MKNNPFDKLRTRKGTASLVVVIAIVVVALIAGYFAFKYSGTTNNGQAQNDQVAIKQLIESFGSKLNDINKLRPESEVKTAIQKSYSDFATSELLSRWLANPQEAPGRTVSSPSPDRIEVDQISIISPSDYTVIGSLIWWTSAGESKQSVYVSVVKEGDKWFINKFELQPQSNTDKTADWEIYISEDPKYVFELKHPSDWSLTKDWPVTIAQNGTGGRLYFSIKTVQGFSNYTWESRITNAKVSYNKQSGKWESVVGSKKDEEKIWGMTFPGDEIYLLQSKDAGWSYDEYIIPLSNRDLVVVLSTSYGSGEGASAESIQQTATFQSQLETVVKTVR